MEAVPKAVAFILSKFTADPSLDKKFVEFESSDSLKDMIAAYGAQLLYIGLENHSRDAAKLAQFGKMKDHKSWMEDQYFRGHAVDLLKDAGLLAAWSKPWLQTRGPGFEYASNAEDRVVHKFRQVLTVTLPTAAESVKQHREKRQRTG